MIEGYLKTMIEAIAVACDPANKELVTRLLAANLRFAAFFRACAGLRDSIIGAEGDEGEPDHRAQRTKIRSRMIKLAAGSLADIHRKAGLSEAEFMEIVRGLNAL